MSLILTGIIPAVLRLPHLRSFLLLLASFVSAYLFAAGGSDENKQTSPWLREVRGQGSGVSFQTS